MNLDSWESGEPSFRALSSLRWLIGAPVGVETVALVSRPYWTFYSNGQSASILLSRRVVTSLKSLLKD
jgi:hypothetical protein